MSTELAAFLSQHSYRAGTFRLASGRESDFYVDVKRSIFRADGAQLIGEELCNRLQAHGIKLVGGMAVGAIPLVTASQVAAATRSYDLDGFFVRKDVKDHGTASRIDGRFNPDYPVALLEDVVTTGGSTLTAVDAVEEAGGHVAVIITVV
ncbi:MAG: orotate phosphoribosyltransferase, partial [Candidatus Binatia bacterium]